MLYMDKEFAKLYQRFLLDTDTSKLEGLTEYEAVEQGFWKAMDYWEFLKDYLRANVFQNDEEEIAFFRNVKPLFTSYIQYFVLLSEAIHFAPGAGPTDSNELIIVYWKQEINRCERYYEKNKFFIHYYESGQHDQDYIYFLRRNNTQEIRVESLAPVHEEGNEFCTYGDPMLRGYFAYKKYEDYVRKQLSKLKSSEVS